MAWVFSTPRPPADEALFNPLRWASDAKKIRSHRKATITLCLRCGKGDDELGRRLHKCAKCLTAAYCSKEVKANASTRSQLIRFSIAGSARVATGQRTKGCVEKRASQKLMMKLMSNPILAAKLESCFIPAFDLLRRTRYDEMLHARVDVAVEPSNIDDFANIFLREGSSKKSAHGMLQINAFTPTKEPLTFAEWGETEFGKLWREERTKANSEGHTDSAVAIMDVRHADSTIALIIPVRIDAMLKKAVEVWKSDGLSLPTPRAPGTMKVPYTIETCMEFINTQIRADKHNRELVPKRQAALCLVQKRHAAFYKFSPVVKFRHPDAVTQF
ncbi:hypothetical protein C8R45DRAFT_1147869 [Mycena sanguinolenta]|nr:hypothetical protein C8R45DRAFT_1147869 [Mycena sanguinolenta]